MAQPVVPVPKVPSQKEIRPSPPTTKPLATRKLGKAVVPHSQTDRQRQVGHPVIPTYSEVHLASNYFIFFSLSLLTICPIFPFSNVNLRFHTEKKRCSPHLLAQVYKGPLSHCEGFEPTSDSTLEPLPPSKPPPLCLSQQPSTAWSSRSHWNMGLPDEGAMPHIWTHSSASTCAGSSSVKGQSRSTGAQEVTA